MNDKVKYVPLDYGTIEISPDNGQGITFGGRGCTNWECSKWCNGVQMAPDLQVNEKGFLVCPVCNCSRGKA